MSNQINRYAGMSSIIDKLMHLKYCFILLMIGTAFSCAHLDEALPDTKGSNSNLPISSRSPTTVSDRVYFADFNEFKDYYLELDSILMANTGDYFDSIVDLTTSVQTLNDIVSTTAGSFGTISDPVLRGMINANNEFQIDDVLVSLINDSQWILSDVSDGTLKTNIRAITKGARFNIGDIPTGAYWVDPTDLEQGIIKIWCGCRVNIEPSDCDEIRVWGSCNGFFGTNGGGDLTVEWTPRGGNTSLILDEEVSNNFEFFINISTFNNSEGGLLAIADGNCTTEINPAEMGFDFDPATFGICDRDNSRLEEIIVNGNERMLVSTYFAKLAFTNTHNAEIFSESRSGIASPWQRTRASLEVSVDANRQSIACAFIESKDDDKSCNNCRHQTVRVTWGVPCAHCDGDLIGDFVKVKNGTMTRTQSVDFECCE